MIRTRLASSCASGLISREKANPESLARAVALNGTDPCVIRPSDCLARVPSKLRIGEEI